MGWVLPCFCACANLFFSAGMHSIILHFFVFFDHFSRDPHAVLCIRARDHFSIVRGRAQICFFQPKPKASFCTFSEFMHAILWGILPNRAWWIYRKWGGFCRVFVWKKSVFSAGMHSIIFAFLYRALYMVCIRFLWGILPPGQWWCGHFSDTMVKSLGVDEYLDVFDHFCESFP